jgi:hypothetical protein
MLTERMFAGRLNEAYEFMQTECNRTMKSYEASLPDEWRDARKGLNAYFNTDNLIRRLRNKQAFHMDLNTTREPDVMPSLPPIVINGPGLFDVRIPFYCAKPPSVDD